MSDLISFFLSRGDQVAPWMIVPRTIIIAFVAIAYVRMAKKRFIAQASAMDLVLAVIFGSLLSRGITGGASLASTLIAGLTLVIIERVLIHFSAQSPKFGRWVKGTYNVLVRDGVIDWHAMRRHDISEADLKLEMRLNGHVDNTADIALATLERNGRISVIAIAGPEVAKRVKGN